MDDMLTINLTHDASATDHRCYAGFAIRFSRSVERPRIYDSGGPCPCAEHRRQYQRIYGSEVGVDRAAADETARATPCGVPNPSGWRAIPFQHPVLSGRPRAEPILSGYFRTGILEREPHWRSEPGATAWRARDRELLHDAGRGGGDR